MGNTPKWERGSHLEISTDEKLDYLYARDDAQQEQIDANIVKVTPATYPEGTETYNIATIKVGNTTKTLKGKEGGGGGGSTGLFPITLTWSADWSTATLNKTFSEIKTALESGLFPYVTSIRENGGDYNFDIYALEQIYGGSDGWTAVVTIIDESGGQENIYSFTGVSLSSTPFCNA